MNDAIIAKQLAAIAATMEAGMPPSPASVIVLRNAAQGLAARASRGDGDRLVMHVDLASLDVYPVEIGGGMQDVYRGLVRLSHCCAAIAADIDGLNGVDRSYAVGEFFRAVEDDWRRNPIPRLDIEKRDRNA